MGLQSNGVMHKRWIRNEGKSETEWGRDDWESRRKKTERKDKHGGKMRPFMLENISFTDNQFCILEHDAKYLKHFTSVEVQKRT